jgi:hypothetical protein
LLEDDDRKLRNMPMDVRIAAAKTLCSVLCLPNRYPTLKVPIVTFNQLQTHIQSKQENHTISEISCSSVSRV